MSTADQTTSGLPSVWARSIFEEPRFTEECEAIYGSVEAADAAVAAVKFLIAREPHSEGLLVDSGAQLYAVKVPASERTKGIVVYYTFDANDVCLRSIIEIDIVLG